MRTLIAATMLAGLVATPVFAQSNERPTTPINPPAVTAPNGTVGQGRPNAPPSTDRGNDAYNSRGNYVGSDPDPRIRDELKRDQPGETGDSPKVPNR